MDLALDSSAELVCNPAVVIIGAGEYAAESGYRSLAFVRQDVDALLDLWCARHVGIPSLLCAASADRAPAHLGWIYRKEGA